MTYLHHRWAIESGVGYIGGMYHNIVLKGETLPPTEMVPAALQREVLGLLMEAIQPGNMAIPESLLAQLTPSPRPNLEDLSDGYTFDHLRAARILAAMVIEPLLAPASATRLVALRGSATGALSLPEVVDAILAHTWRAAADADPKTASLRRVSQRVALDAMMMLGASEDTSPEARAYILDQIAKLGESLGTRKDENPLAEAHYRQAGRDIARYWRTRRSGPRRARCRPGAGGRGRVIRCRRDRRWVTARGRPADAHGSLTVTLNGIAYSPSFVYVFWRQHTETSMARSADVASSTHCLLAVRVTEMWSEGNNRAG